VIDRQFSFQNVSGRASISTTAWSRSAAIGSRPGMLLADGVAPAPEYLFFQRVVQN